MLHFAHELPTPIRAYLAAGHPVGAEIAAARTGARAFIIVLPRLPDPHTHPEAWFGLAGVLPGVTMQLKDARSIRGYEVRYIEHDPRYMEDEWGWDADYVLADVTTRVRRTFVSQEADLGPALAPWLRTFDQLRPTYHLDSALVTSRLEWYLDQPERFPHLTQP